jgi:hypothetical protein
MVLYLPKLAILQVNNSDSVSRKQVRVGSYRGAADRKVRRFF